MFLLLENIHEKIFYWAMLMALHINSNSGRKEIRKNFIRRPPFSSRKLELSRPVRIPTFMDITHITELKLWADILTETSRKSQKLVGSVRYSNICERSLYEAHGAGAHWQRRGKGDIERARTQTPSAFSLFVRLIFTSPLSLSHDVYPQSWWPFLSINLMRKLVK